MRDGVDMHTQKTASTVREDRGAATADVADSGGKTPADDGGETPGMVAISDPSHTEPAHARRTDGRAGSTISLQQQTGRSSRPAGGVGGQEQHPQDGRRGAPTHDGPSIMLPAPAEVPTAVPCESTRTQGRVAPMPSPAPACSSAQGELSSPVRVGGSFGGVDVG